MCDYGHWLNKLSNTVEDNSDFKELKILDARPKKAMQKEAIEHAKKWFNLDKIDDLTHEDAATFFEIYCTRIIGQKWVMRFDNCNTLDEFKKLYHDLESDAENV